MPSVRLTAFFACCLLLATGIAGAQSLDPADIAQRWSTMSAAEREAIRQQVVQARPQFPTGPGETPNDVCGGATLETGPFPFVDSASIGALADDYVQSAPICGTTIGGITGLAGSDIAYAFQVDISCTLQVDASVQVPMSPEGGGGGFLSGYVVTDCGDITNTCVSGDEDFPAGDGMIGFSFAAAAGTTYFLILDGTLGSVTEPVNLAVSDPTGQGCTLIPVELSGFTVE